ncbi:MAG: Nif3-like dinuclear metal center hexameric protein [Defluviitaleaceae bacterium]|nr:Nif3-like dinuclear metal center hexameric protein [Defluviitaleaceae bacterium]
MKSTDLYSQLNKYFIKPGMKEENWYEWMNGLDEYICENFKQHSMGLMCDFAQEIKKVYTAVFPSDDILTKILNENIHDAMLFIHHPMVWDLSKDPDNAFYDVNAELLGKLKERRVSLFNFHVPHDNFSEYSTTKTLAVALGIKIEKPFSEYHGGLCGVIGTTDCKDIHELNEKYSQTVRHDTKLYQYGENKIFNNRVAVVAGGGNDNDVVNDVVENKINVLITGVSLKNKYSIDVHELEKEKGINLLGGTHYSSEKFGCNAMCEYFKKIGLPSEFINSSPCFDDL